MNEIFQKLVHSPNRNRKTDTDKKKTNIKILSGNVNAKKKQISNSYPIIVKRKTNEKNKFQIFARKSKNGGAMKKQVSKFCPKIEKRRSDTKTNFKLLPANRKPEDQ